MLHDITEYCENCVCQASKQLSPQKKPLINMPVGKPWQIAHFAQAAHKQKIVYDQHTQQRTFKIDHQSVWLSSPTAGKFDAKWEVEWKIKTVRGPTTYTITDGTKSKTVHMNRLCLRTQPACLTTDKSTTSK